jgi:hypothetical protein
MSYPVIHRVAKDSGSDEDEDKDFYVQETGSCKCTGDKDEGIPGQVRQNDKAGLAEDDSKENEVGPDTISLNDSRKVFIEVDDQVNQGEQNHFPLFWMWQRIKEFFLIFLRKDPTRSGISIVPVREIFFIPFFYILFMKIIALRKTGSV